jgi:hypothetical protein
VARSSLSRWVRRPGPCPNPDERAPSAILFLSTGVSARDRNPTGKGDQFDVAGCEWVFIGHASGKLASRPELDMALLVAEREGDTLALLKGAVISSMRCLRPRPRRSRRRALLSDSPSET